MSNNKTLKVFSSTAVAGMIAAAMMSSQAFAAVDAYSVKVGDQVYKYDRVELEKSFLDAKAGDKAALYDDFTKKLGDAKGFYAFNDTKNGYVDYKSIEAKFLESKDAGKAFDVNEFTESKDAKVLEVKTVKKAVVNKDGKVEYKEETSEVDPNAEVQVTSVEVLNLKQVKINFAKAVTDSDKKDDIETVENYTLEDKDGDELDKDMVKKVKLDASKKFAILTFRDKVNNKGKYLIENQEKYTLKIDEDVTGNEVKQELKFKDSELPEVKDVEVVGVDTIKVTFSEPVMPQNIEKVSEDRDVTPELDDDDFEINDGDISINKVELVHNNTEANIVVGTDFKNDQKVKLRVKSTVRDYAGLATVSTPKEVNVKQDKKVPEVVGYQDIETKDGFDKVSLMFDKDIKFKNMDETVIKNSSDLENYYHSSDKSYNRPKKVKVDGRKLTLYFAEDSISNGTTNIYIKSGSLESRWNVENDKISTKIVKEEDNEAPKLTKVKQHEDYNNKIKIKFSEKVKCGSDREDNSATKVKNYTLKDNNGREWKINDVYKDGSSEKEFIIETTKDLDQDLKYNLTVENVEDKAGNAIKKVKQDFTVKDKDSVEEDDIKVKVYSPGTSNQKIVIDFDTKMKADSSRYSVKDLSKYTLIAKQKGNPVKVFDGKASINMSEMYKSDIKMAKSGKAVEINLPSKDVYDNLKDKQYMLNDLRIEPKNKLKDVELYVQVDRVSDINDNVTDRNFERRIEGFFGKGEEGTLTFDTDKDYKPQVISPEEIFFAFNDKVDFNIKDIMVIAADSSKKAENAVKAFVSKASDEKYNEDDIKAVTQLEISTHKKGTNTDGNTTVTLTLSKDNKDKRYDDDDYSHVLTYDGKYQKIKEVKKVEEGKEKVTLVPDGKLDVYVFAIPNKKVGDKYVTSTKNDYDETIKLGKPELIEDKIAPVIKNNDIMVKDYKEGKDEDNNDEVIEYWNAKVDENEKSQEKYQGVLVLNFEEEIDPASVSKSTVELNKKDFKDAEVEDYKVVGNKIIFKLNKLTDGKDNKDNWKAINIEKGDQITVRGLRDKNNNEAKDLKLQVGDFKLDAEPAELAELKDAEAVKNVEDMIAKLPEKDAIKIADKDAVVAARAAFDKLVKQGDVKAGIVKKLTDAEAKIGELEAAAKDTANNEAAESFKTAQKTVLDLTEDTVKIENKGIVDNAKTEFDKLDNDVKAKLTNQKDLIDNLKKVIAVKEEAVKITKDGITELVDGKNVLTQAKALVGNGVDVIIEKSTNTAIATTGEITQPEKTASDVTGDVTFKVTKDGKITTVIVKLTIAKKTA